MPSPSETRGNAAQVEAAVRSPGRVSSRPAYRSLSGLHTHTHPLGGQAGSWRSTGTGSPAACIFRLIARAGERLPLKPKPAHPQPTPPASFPSQPNQHSPCPAFPPSQAPDSQGPPSVAQSPPGTIHVIRSQAFSVWGPCLPPFLTETPVRALSHAPALALGS